MEDYTLSLNGGRRLAVIKSTTKNNGKIVYLYDRKKMCCGDCKKDDCKKKCCDYCCMKFYHKSPEKEQINHIVLEGDEHFEELPTNDPNQTNILMISARAGAGKSVYLKKYIENYKKIYNENKVYLFSESKSDKNLDPLVKRVPLEEFSESGLKWDDFDDSSFVALDDIDVLENTKENGYLKKKLYHLMNGLIQNARKKHITVAQTVHIATDGPTTKHILNSCTSFIIFLNSISLQQKNALKNYLGITPENIKKILSMSGRWVCIFTSSPLVVMGEKEMYILNNK